MNKKNCLLGFLLVLSLLFALVVITKVPKIEAAPATFPQVSFNAQEFFVDTDSVLQGCSKSGTCTNGDWVCEEGAGSANACEFECVTGSWKGYACGTNMCDGGRCHQGGKIEEVSSPP